MRIHEGKKLSCIDTNIQGNNIYASNSQYRESRKKEVINNSFHFNSTKNSLNV